MQQDWVVYSSPGLREPEQVLDYLARYTHRTAISNARLLSMDDSQVRFRYKDYRDHEPLEGDDTGGRGVYPPLPAACPAQGLMRIRHYGFLANSCRRRKLALIRTALTCGRNIAKTDSNASPERFTGYPCPNADWAAAHHAEMPPQRWEGG